jgi:RHS repeat-associated protein
MPEERGQLFSSLNEGVRFALVKRICLGLMALLVITLADVPAMTRPAAAAEKAPAAAPRCPADRQNVASAAVAAKLCGARVEALDRRTETSQIFANPDGTLTEERAMAPVRVRTESGWDDVDLNLIRRADGSVVPRVHPRNLVLSGRQPDKGEHEVVSLGSGAQRTSIAWNGTLPEPTLDGRTATYPEVLPGVDLQIVAHATGYEQYFVAKDRPALERVEKLTLPMSTGKLTAADDGAGGLLFKDAKGTTVGRAQAPEMWDSEVSPVSMEHRKRAPVGLKTSRKGAGKAVMELTPDADFVARADLTFPVTIDPPASLPVAFDAFVQNGWTSDQSGSADLKLGHVVDGGTYTARSYLRFGTTGLWGSRVTSAKLRLWNYHSYSCTASSWEAWRSDRADASVRWTAQPTAREKVGTSTETKGYNSSCGDGYVYIEVGKALQSAADGNWNDVTVMLRGTNESDTKSWKRFDSAEGAHPPLLSITYNAAPGVPSAQAVTPCYSSCGASARTSSLRPTLSAKLADANAGQALRASFEIRNKATGAVVASSGALTGNPGWTTGSTASWQVSANLANNTTYQWRVAGLDPYSTGAFTAWTDLTVDTDKPLVPFVSAAIYLNDGQPHGGAGQSDTFTLTPANGTTDLAAFVYRLDTDAAATTVAATGTTTVTLSPRDGQRTLTVQAKDRAGNLSNPNLYTFSAGNAALAQPLPGATVVKRTKLQITTPVSGYTRAYFEYRRGPGGVVLPVPSANLTSAAGAPITATAASPVAFSALGGHAVWNAADTLGAVGGVVEIRARIYTATSTAPVYDTAWVRVTVDSNGDGNAGEEVGPGEVDLLSGNLSMSATDVDELGLSVSRSASSRTPADGYVAMPQKLSANQQQVSTDLSGFTVPATATAARVTSRGQGEVTPADSLEITPAASGTSNDTYVAVGGDTGGLRLGMQPGRTYRMTGWIFVPAATGLAPSNTDRGLRIVGWHRTGTAGYVPVPSPMAAFTEGWQELSVDMTVPAGATEALFRLYNGNLAGSGRKVYWDNLSVTEVVAPFSASWTGGATGGAAESDYTTLSFPQPSVARVTTSEGGWITFSRNTAGAESFTPEPGNEGLVLSRPDASTYRLRDVEGTVSEFKQQGGVWTVTSSWTDDEDSTTRYVYDTSGGRLLLKRVVNPTEPGVDDAGGCTGTAPPRGCEVLEYVYATSTTAGLSQTVFGDYTDRVSAVRIWNWDPQAGAVNAVEVARYAYDNLGRLREVWDPRVSPALKTTYAYDAANRVTGTGPPGELPWAMDYANPDVDSAALRWDLDGNATDSSGSGRNGTATGGVWAESNDPANPGDRAVAFAGSATQQITASGTALSNTAAFTVSAWAQITDTTVNRTIVSKDGTRTSGFFLNYVAAANRWAFSRTTADNDSSSAVRATSNVAPTVGQWTHLAGVFDPASGRMKLYVNGVLQSTTAATSGAWNATGNYVVGRAKWAGANANPWMGSIDDVRVYGAALNDAQIADLAGDENTGRLVRVRRAALQTGSKTATDGEITTSLVYNVPLTQAAGGPYTLNAATAATWAQSDVPTDATAVFDPEEAPARHSATPASPGSAGYRYATVHYLNAHGREVNTASPGGHIDTQEYDRFGNVVRSLEATDRALALGTYPGGSTHLAALGLLDSDTAARALALSSVNSYSSDGLDLLETVGPTGTMVLENELADPDGAGPLTALERGATVIGRARTVNKYDEGKPDGAAYHLVTTTTKSAQIDGYPAADARVSRKGYEAEHGGVSGWVLKKPTKVVGDAGGANITSYVVHDAAGRVLKSWGVASTGGDAAAVENVYYTAGANPKDAACGNRPEWAGDACLTRPAAAVTGHDPDRMSSDLPARRILGYNRFGDTTTTAESAAGQTRTTVTTYDTAGRTTGVAITGGQGAALTEQVIGYDPATGKAVQTTAGPASITTEYDQLGRTVKYTDADGAATTTEYDRFGRPSKVSNPTGNMTYAYDRAVDPRGLLTSSTDSAAGTFAAKYSPDGQLVELKYPGGLTRTDRLDANLQPVERVYTRDTDGATIYAESVQENSHSQWVEHEYTGGTKTYSYDRLGRLTRVRHVNASLDGCVTRAYSYDGRTNRTGRTVYAPGEEGACSTATASTSSEHTYDSADRLTDPGYVYDAFGRTVAEPGEVSTEYYVNDLVRRRSMDDARTTWTLDPAQRFRGYTEESLVDGAWAASGTKLNHYGDDSDEPSWIVEDTATGASTRMVEGPGDELVATAASDGQIRLQLSNLHGDIAVTIDTGLSEPEIYDNDEFGSPLPGQAAQRYGWHGAAQRSGDAPGGVILMGARLYSRDLGRFLQVDPVAGGSATAYDYCNADPVNCSDLDGKLPRWMKSVGRHLKNNWRSYAVGAVCIVGSVLACGVASAINIGYNAYQSKRRTGRVDWRGVAFDAGLTLAGGGIGRMIGGGFRSGAATRAWRNPRWRSSSAAYGRCRCSGPRHRVGPRHRARAQHRKVRYTRWKSTRRNLRWNAGVTFGGAYASYYWNKHR